jgi:hypothetical protein
MWQVLTDVSEEHIVSILYYEDGGSIFLRNVGSYVPDYTVLEYHRINLHRRENQKSLCGNATLWVKRWTADTRQPILDSLWR